MHSTGDAIARVHTGTPASEPCYIVHVRGLEAGIFAVTIDRAVSVRVLPAACRHGFTPEDVREYALAAIRAGYVPGLRGA